MEGEKIVKTIFILLFIVFITIYISQANGYYEYELHKRVELTNEQIKKFEEDVKNNKKIDLKEYTMDGVENYNNNFSKLGSNFSKVTSKYVKKGISGFFGFVENLLS